MQTFSDDEVRNRVANFLRMSAWDGAAEPRPAAGRELSFDFAYNHFAAHPQPTGDMETSCLQLGYYLASWGMLRGSSYLFRNTNLRHYRAAVATIEDVEPQMRRVDAHRYGDPQVAELMVSTYARLRGALVPATVSHVTLVTKVMLGVWGATPAFDRYLQTAATRIWSDRRRGDGARFNQFNTQAISRLSEFYDAHAGVIEELHKELRTVRFDSGGVSEWPVTRAKVIDMFMFQLGYAG